MVALTVIGASNDEIYFCGGSIISRRTVLTAAHCIAAVEDNFGYLNRSLTGIVGTNSWDDGGVRYKFSSHVIHQLFNPSTFMHDLGLLYTTRRIKFTDVIKPIRIETKIVFPYMLAHTCGWGRIGFNEPPSNELHELTDIYTVSNLKCRIKHAIAKYSDGASEDSLPINIFFQLCAIHSDGAGSGVCQGDSGSPLVSTYRGTQIGIVSWGYPCARGIPDIFTRVSTYQFWIAENVKH